MGYCVQLHEIYRKELISVTIASYCNLLTIAA